MLTLVDFYADWCGPCKYMTPIFEEIEKDYAGKIEFKKIDVDENNEEAMKNGVMGIPTFIIFDGEKEVDRRTGAMPKDALVQWLNSSLKK